MTFGKLRDGFFVNTSLLYYKLIITVKLKSIISRTRHEFYVVYKHTHGDMCYSVSLLKMYTLIPYDIRSPSYSKRHE